LGPSLGTFGWLHYQKYAVRAEVKQMMINKGMAEEHLVVLQFTTEEKALLNWEHDKEFEYQGQMYDVVDSYQVGDIFYYSCWPDMKKV